MGMNNIIPASVDNLLNFTKGKNITEGGNISFKMRCGNDIQVPFFRKIEKISLGRPLGTRHNIRMISFFGYISGRDESVVLSSANSELGDNVENSRLLYLHQPDLSPVPLHAPDLQERAKR